MGVFGGFNPSSRHPFFILLPRQRRTIGLQAISKTDCRPTQNGYILPGRDEGNHMDNLIHPQSMNCRTCRFFEQTDLTCRKNPPEQNPTYGYAWPQITRAPVPSGIYWCGQWVKHPDAVPVNPNHLPDGGPRGPYATISSTSGITETKMDD